MEKSGIDEKIPTKKLITLGVVGAILILFPLVVKSPYINHLVIMMCIYVMLGMGFVMIYNTGLISLGCAAYYAIGAYVSALLVMEGGLSFWLALPVSTITASIIALMMGVIMLRTGGVPFVFLTMISGLVVVQAVANIQFCGGWGGILSIPVPDPINLGPLGVIEFTGKAPYYYLIMCLMLFFMLVFYALYESRIGRAWKAIKQSRDLAEAMGINIFRYRLLAFVVASTAAGAAGSFYAHYYQGISPESFGGWPSIFIQLYPVLGGMDYALLGSVAGALFMGIVPQALSIAKEFEPLLTGPLILSVILFFPGGIVGLLKQSPRAMLASSPAAWILRRLRGPVRQQK